MPSLDTSLTGSSTRRTFLTGAAAAVAAGMVGIAFVDGALPASAAQSNAWGGYTNGRIPYSAMTKVAGTAWLRADAANGYNVMAAAFKAKFGKTLGVTQGYRDYPSQQAIWVSRYVGHRNKVPNSIYWSGNYWTKKPNVSVAAPPGTSVHGWALAVDFSSNVNVAGSAEKKWADANSGKYGWHPIGNNFGEPWHFEYTPPQTQPKKR